MKGLKNAFFMPFLWLQMIARRNWPFANDNTEGPGVNAYGQPDRRISVFFYDFPISVGGLRGTYDDDCVDGGYVKTCGFSGGDWQH